MSYFDELEAHGGLDPYASAAQAEREAEESHFSKCGCGHPDCVLDDRDATNVTVNGIWFTADCVGLCVHCGEIEDFSKLMKLGGGRFAHTQGCPDRMNEVRR